MAQKQIKIGIGFNIDKTGLDQLQTELGRISAQASVNAAGKNINQSLQSAGKTAQWLSDILEDCFNQDLGTVNIVKFNSKLNEAHMNLSVLKKSLEGAGSSGSQIFNAISSAILGTNIKLKESNKLVDNLVKSMSNTVTWGITSSIFNTVTNSISRAVNYAEDLNSSLTDIRIVTEASSDQMERFAESANRVAKELGASTLAYTDAALIYYQQGLNEADVQARAEATVKAANVTGQAGQVVSEQLTAVWNGFQVTAKEAELYVDKLAAVAAKTGADLQELSIGMGKVASAANAMGVDIDQLNAQLATVITVTRQAPESVGTAFKTIYARLGDLDIDGVTEDGVKLGEVAAQLNEVGIKILDDKRELREVGTIVEEVAAKWNTWNSAQRQAVAIAMAGTRQYNNLLALFDNWDMYTAALETSTNALGTLQKQQDIYMESTEAKLKTLDATWQDLYEDIIDEETVHFTIEALTNIVGAVNKLINSFGGGIPGLVGFGSMFLHLFDKQISQAIVRANNNFENFKHNLINISLKEQALQAGKATFQEREAPKNRRGESIQESAAAYERRLMQNAQGKAQQAGMEAELRMAKELQGVLLGISNEEYQQFINQQNILKDMESQVALQKEMYQIMLNKAKLPTDISQEQLFENLNNIEVKIEQAQTKIDNFQTALDEGVDDFSIYQSAFDITGADTAILQEPVRNAEQINTILNRAIEIKREQIDLNNKEAQELKKIISMQDKLVNQEEQKKQFLKQYNEELEKAKKSTQIQKITTGLTASVSLLTNTWQGLNSAIQIFNDESLSAGQKAGQFITVLTTTLPMGVSAFMRLNEALGYNGSLVSNLLLLKEKSNSMDVIANALGLENLGTLDKKKQAQLFELAAQDKLNKDTLTSIGLGEVANKVDWESAASKDALSKATMGAKTAQDAYNISLWASPLFIVAAVVLGVIGAVVGLNAALDALSISQEEANTALKKSVDTYKKNKQEIESLEIELNSLEEKIKELEELGELTIVQDEQLTKLRAQKELIEAAAEAQEKLNAAQKLDIIRNTQDVVNGPQGFWHGVAQFLIGESLDTLDSSGGLQAFVNFMQLSSPISQLAQYFNKDSTFRKNAAAFFGEGIVNIKSSDEYSRYLNLNTGDYAELTSLRNSIAKQIDELKKKGSNITVDEKTALREYESLLKILEDTYGTSSETLAAYAQQVESVKLGLSFMQEGSQEQKKAQNFVLDYYKNTEQWSNLVQGAFEGAAIDTELTEEIWKQAQDAYKTKNITQVETLLGEDFINKIKDYAQTYGVSFESLWNGIFSTTADFESIISKQEEILSNVNKKEIDEAQKYIQKLQQIQNEYEKIQKQKEHISKSSKEYNDLLNKEIYNLQLQAQLQSLILQEREYDAEAQRTKLKEYGFSFYEDGRVANSQEGILKKYLGSEDYEEIKTALDNYNKLILEEMPNLESQIMDTLYSQIQVKNEQATLKVTLQLETNQAERDWNDFLNSLKDIDEDDILGKLQNSSINLSSYKTDLTVATNEIPKIMQEIANGKAGKNSQFSVLNPDTGEYVFDEVAAKAELQKYVDLGKASIEAIAEIKETIQDSYLQALEQADEKFDKQLQIYERINATAEKNIKIINLLSGENNFNALKNQYNKQISTNQSYLDMLKKELQYWNEQRQKGDESIRKQAEEKWIETNEKIQQATLNSIEIIKQAYINSLNKVIDDFNQTLLENGVTLDLIEKEWSLITEDADRYLDATNAAYEISKLESSYLTSINELDTLSSQEALNDLMKTEIGYLRAKERLTKADVERAELRYQIALKQQQLEDQKNNATQLKLQRDAFGNYTYAFVADETEVAKTQQELADLNNQLYNVDKEAYRNNFKDIYDIYNEFSKAMVEAMQIEDQEEREKAKAALYEQYEKKITSIIQDNEFIRAELIKDGFSSIDESLKNSTLYKFISSITTKGFNGIIEFFENDAMGFDSALSDYNNNLTQVENKLGLDFAEIISGTKDLTLISKELKLKNEDVVSSLNSLNANLSNTIAPLLTLLNNTLSNDNLDTIYKGLKILYPDKFDTGGYTGTWGQSGKLAIVHEKELILNKTDTPNILQAVSIVRDISAIINSFRSGLQHKIAANIPNTSSITNNIIREAAKTVDQNVQIEAHFHDATTANEIETAFTNLINLASQKAYEDKK